MRHYDRYNISNHRINCKKKNQRSETNVKRRERGKERKKMRGRASERKRRKRVSGKKLRRRKAIRSIRSQLSYELTEDFEDEGKTIADDVAEVYGQEGKEGKTRERREKERRERKKREDDGEEKERRMLPVGIRCLYTFNQV